MLLLVVVVLFTVFYLAVRDRVYAQLLIWTEMVEVRLEKWAREMNRERALCVMRGYGMLRAKL